MAIGFVQFAGAGVADLLFYFSFFTHAVYCFLSVSVNLKVSLPKKETKKARPGLFADLPILACEMKRTATAPPGSFAKTVHWTVF